MIFVVHSGSPKSISSVTLLAHCLDILHSNVAARTGKGPQVLDAGQKYFLGVIRRISEYTRIKTPFLLVVARHLNPVAIRFDKVSVQNKSPLLMEEFPLAMRQEGGINGGFTGQFDKEVLEIVGELTKIQCESRCGWQAGGPLTFSK